jgi:integrase
MAVKVKHWKGAYWVFINHRGRRKAKRVGEGDKAKRAAQRAAEIIQGKLASGDISALDEARGRVRSLKDFAEEWLKTAVLLHCKPATQENYHVAMRRHWLPALGSLSLGAVTRERIRTVMAEKLSKKELKPSSLRSALIPLSSCLHAALEAGLIPGNPATRLSRFLRRPDEAEALSIDPFTPAELTTILTTAEQQMPECYPLILTLARTGLRIGEALALKREDLDFRQGTLWVRRTWGRRTIGTPKTGKARRVDMSRQLRRVLEAHLTLREAEAVVAGRADSPWLVPDPERPDEALPLSPLAFYKGIWWALLRRSGVRYRKRSGTRSPRYYSRTGRASPTCAISSATAASE